MSDFLLKFSNPTPVTRDYASYFKALQVSPTKTASGKTKIAKLDLDNFIYTAVVGLSSNEWNANWDYIPSSELLKEVGFDKIAGEDIDPKQKYCAWQTWVGRPNPRNHKLEDIAREVYNLS